MRRLYSVLVFLLLVGCSVGIFRCRWDEVGRARSLIINRCLRLTVKNCVCSTSFGCPAKEYEDDIRPPWESCSAVITWCSWGRWDHDVRTVSGSNSCARYSIRKRECCIDDRGSKTPTINVKSRSWRCVGQGTGAETQTHIASVQCPGHSTATMPLVFFAIVVVLLIITTAIIVLRIFCRSKLASCWRRTTTVMAPARCTEHAVPTVMAAAPPRYEDAVAHMPAPPTYEQAVEAQGHTNLAVVEDSPREEQRVEVTTVPKPSDDEEGPERGEGVSSSGQGAVEMTNAMI